MIELKREGEHARQPTDPILAMHQSLKLGIWVLVVKVLGEILPRVMCATHETQRLAVRASALYLCVCVCVCVCICT